MFFSLEYIPHLKTSLCLKTQKTNQEEAELLLLGSIEFTSPVLLFIFSCSFKNMPFKHTCLFVVRYLQTNMGFTIFPNLQACASLKNTP